MQHGITSHRHPWLRSSAILFCLAFVIGGQELPTTDTLTSDESPKLRAGLAEQPLKIAPRDGADGKSPLERYAKSNGLSLETPASYQVSGSSVTLKAARVANNTTGRPGTLRLELWATSSPYSGGTINGYQTAIYRFSSTLAAREYFYDINQTVAWHQLLQ
jgi:hypothetical protein